MRFFITITINITINFSSIGKLGVTALTTA
jgi:hypothetical protein